MNSARISWRQVEAIHKIKIDCINKLNLAMDEGSPVEKQSVFNFDVLL